MTPEIMLAVSHLVVLVIGAVMMKFFGGKKLDAPTPAPSPEPTPAPVNDPLAGLPGLPGHPFANALLRMFLEQLGQHVQAKHEETVSQLVQNFTKPK